MAKNEWQYQRNQFDNCTENSRKRMLLISTDHDSKLNAQTSDPDIEVLYNHFHPKHLSFVAKYTEWMTSKAAYNGSTQMIKSIFNQLTSDKIELWDIQIQIVFRQKTPEYIALLPNGRGPFQKKSYEQRILALKSLSANIGNEERLAAVKSDIIEFTTKIEDSRNEQQGKEGLIAKLSDELEQQRIKCAKGMYYNLGGLMQKYVDNPELISNFYELENIRKTGREEQEIPEAITGTIDADEKVILADGGFTADTNYLLKNIGDTQLKFYTAESVGIVPENALMLESGAEINVVASQLGTVGNQLLIVYNPDSENTGEYFVNQV